MPRRPSVYVTCTSSGERSWVSNTFHGLAGHALGDVFDFDFDFDFDFVSLANGSSRRLTSEFIEQLAKLRHAIV